MAHTQMKSQDTLSFVKVTDLHIPLLFSWLNASHLKGHYDDGYDSSEEIKSKFVEDQQGVHRFIAYCKERPVGYIQTYRIEATHDYAAYRHSEGLTVGIDLFVGEESLLGQGYGFQMLQQFIVSLEQGIERIIVDPCEANKPSMALFYKYGFMKIGEFFLGERKQCILGINIRKATRGIIINGLDEVLLIHMKADPLKKTQKSRVHFWLTPGGKVESFENYEQALVREIKEEVGFTDIQVDRVLFSDERVDTWDQFPLRLFNRYYLVRSHEVNFSTQYLMDYEREVVLGYKWWSLEDLLTTNEVVYPHNLAKELEALRAPK